MPPMLTMIIQTSEDRRLATLKAPTCSGGAKAPRTSSGMEVMATETSSTVRKGRALRHSRGSGVVPTMARSRWSESLDQSRIRASIAIRPVKP